MKTNNSDYPATVCLSTALSLVFWGAAVNAASPRINYQPQNQTVILYQQAAFGAMASGTAPLCYQWRKDGVPIVGATNDQIVLAQSNFSDAGLYSVVVSNTEGAATSERALLTVNAPKAGDLDCSFVCGGSINGRIHSVAGQPDGKLLIAGIFSTVHGAVRRGIARLNSDGTTDHTFVNGLFTTSTEDYVEGTSIALQSDGKVIIAIHASRANAPDYRIIARLYANGTLDSSFRTEVSGYVNSVVVQPDDKVLIGGSFSAVSGVSRQCIARLNPDGTLDTGFQNELAGADRRVTSVAVQSDGKVAIGGDFARVNGVGRTNIARLNADGTLDRSFQSRVSGVPWATISSVAVQSDGKVLVGGYFTSVNGVARTNIARLNIDGTVDGSFNPAAGAAPVAVQSDGKIFAGTLRLNGDGSLDSSFQRGVFDLYATIYSVAVQADGKLLVGGDFFRVNGVARNYIARLNADGTLDSAFENGVSGVNGGCSSVAVQSDGKVLLGGSFIAVNNGVARANIARLNENGALDRDFAGELSEAYNVSSLALQEDGKALAGGREYRENVGWRTHIVRLNVDGTLDRGFQNAISELFGGGDLDNVASVAVQSDGKILLGGTSGSADNKWRGILARLNADGTLENSFQNAISSELFSTFVFTFGEVYSVAVQSDGKLLIGGHFTDKNFNPRGIARLNPDGTPDASFLGGLSGSDGVVRSIMVHHDGKFLIGGDFTAVNGIARMNIARLNADGTLDGGFQNGASGANGEVISMAEQSDGKVVLGGRFTLVNGIARTNIARLNADGTLDDSFQSGLSGAGRDVGSVALQRDGKVIIGGGFSMVNGIPARGIARLWGSAEVPPEIKSIQRNGTNLRLIWDAFPNRTYRVQYKDSLSAKAWTDFDGDVAGSPIGNGSKNDTTLPGATQRFYRVVLLP